MRAAQALIDKQARDVCLFDLRGVSDLTDITVLASGASAPQLKAMADHVQHALQSADERCARRSGGADSGWIVLDYLDVVIHIFDPQTRAYYAIEALWQACPRLPGPEQ